MNHSNATRLAKIGGVGLTLLAVAACDVGEQAGGSNSSENLDEMEPITLTWAEMNPEGSAWLDGVHEMIDYVESESDEKITFELYTATSLMEAEDMLSGIGSGAADLGRIVSSYWPQELATSDWYSQTGAEHSADYPHGMIQHSMRSHELHLEDGPLRRELEEQNVTPLTSTATSLMYDMMCTQPVNSAADADGLRVRTLGNVWVDEATELGMTSVPLAINEVYEGLQRGVIDCTMTYPPGSIDYSTWEVAEYYVPVQLNGVDALPLIVNSDVWQELPTEAQQILQDGAHIAWTTHMESLIERYAQFATEGPEEHGIEFTDANELNEELHTFQANRVEAMVNDAPDQVDDPDDFVTHVRDYDDKWLTLIDEDISFGESGEPEDAEDSYVRGVELDYEELWQTVYEEGFEPYRSE